MLAGISLNLGEKSIFCHHKNLPNSFRAILAGGAGCGKSTLLMSMILEPETV